MTHQKKVTTWRVLAEHLGVSLASVNRHKKSGQAPAEKDPDQWREYLDRQRAIETRGGGAITVDGRKYTAADIQDLRGKLINAQERHHSASAKLKELQLEKERKNLVPESVVCDLYVRTVTPLRRLLDAFPRLVASQANPGNPGVAEKAIRQAMNERVYAELCRIENEYQASKGGENQNE